MPANGRWDLTGHLQG